MDMNFALEDIRKKIEKALENMTEEEGRAYLQWLEKNVKRMAD